MKILLTAIDSKFIHSNLAVRYLKTHIEGKGIQTEIKEFTINQQIDYILQEILDVKADLICFSCYIWNIEYIKEIAYILKTTNNNIQILFGGPEVSFEIANVMKENPYIDYIIYGEGEETFREFVDTFNSTNKKFDKIKGLSYRYEGQIHINQKRPLLENIDIIKYPYDYEENFEDKMIYYESSRGCPFSCSFCMSSIDKKVRNFSLERVKNDLKILLNTKARQIKFVDRTFNADHIRAMKIMEYIAENNVNNITVHFEITADIIKDEFLDFLNKMPVNMFQFEIGVQSLNHDTLNEINRNMNVNRLAYVVQEIKSNSNIHMHLDLIAGLPYESYESFKSSFDGIYKLGAEKMQLGFLKVLKGTQIYNDIDKHDIKYRGKAPYEVIQTKYLTLEELLKLKKIEEIVDKYYNEKYFDKSLEYIIDKIYTASPFEFYEKFSDYWQKNGLYKISHGRKKLYDILYNYMLGLGFATEEFVSVLRYDYIYNNPKEEIPTILNRQSEDGLRDVKRKIATTEAFRNKYFKDVKKEDKIINSFRLAQIGKDMMIFIYEDKKNIFSRCKTHIITEEYKRYEEYKGH